MDDIVLGLAVMYENAFIDFRHMHLIYKSACIAIEYINIDIVFLRQPFGKIVI